MSTKGPVDQVYQMQLNALAGIIDGLLNGENCPADQRKVGFALLMFPFGEVPDNRINYISNGDRRDMLAALKELVARFEGRHVEETITGAPKAVQ